MAVFTAIATAIATALGMSLVATSTAIFIGVTSFVLQAACLFGGVALSMALSKKSGDYGSTSPTYSAIKQTQTNPDLPVPLLYGTVKVAGNRIWQDDKYDNGIKRIVAFSDGEIQEFTDIRLNDIPSSDIAGIQIQKFYGLSTQGLPSGLPSGVGLSTLGSLKNTAYLYINVPKSDKIDINYNLTTVIEGRKIRVYSTPTTYVTRYSNNPAWVMFDFLTSYNGRGLCLKADGTIDNDEVAKLFDMQSFIESAAYCDEIVETVGGVSYKRFTFNMIFDAQTSHKTLLDEIQRSCRGGLFTKDGKLQFKIDKAEATSKVFTEADILDGSETFQTLPNEENYEVLKIDYVSPEHEWNKVQAYAELPTTRTGVPVEHSINCYSVTNFQQASRLAWYYLNSKRLCPYFGSFKTGFKAYDLEVGQVISIPVILMGLTNYLVKVTSVVNNGTGTYTVNYRTYDSRLYADTKGCLEPRVIVSKLDDQYVIPKNITNFHSSQVGNVINFLWNYNETLTDLYEIRYGATWTSGEVIVKNLKLNSYSVEARSTGVKTFWIKAFNGYNYSTTAVSSAVQINEIPKMQHYLTIDVINDSDPDETWYNNTQLINGEIKLINNSRSGIYRSGIFDLATLHEAYGNQARKVTLNIDRNYIVENDQNYIQFYYTASNDLFDWTEYAPFKQVSLTTRYVMIKAEFIPYNSTDITLTSLTLNVDVPEQTLYYERQITNASSGTELVYNMTDIPTVVATADNGTAVVTSKSKLAAKIKVKDNNGSFITSTVSIMVRGF